MNTNDRDSFFSHYTISKDNTQDAKSSEDWSILRRRHEANDEAIFAEVNGSAKPESDPTSGRGHDYRTVLLTDSNLSHFHQEDVHDVLKGGVALPRPNWYLPDSESPSLKRKLPEYFALPFPKRRRIRKTSRDKSLPLYVTVSETLNTAEPDTDIDIRGEAPSPALKAQPLISTSGPRISSLPLSVNYPWYSASSLGSELDSNKLTDLIPLVPSHLSDLSAHSNSSNVRDSQYTTHESLRPISPVQTVCDSREPVAVRSIVRAIPGELQKMPFYDDEGSTGNEGSKRKLDWGYSDDEGKLNNDGYKTKRQFQFSYSTPNDDTIEGSDDPSLQHQYRDEEELNIKIDQLKSEIAHLEHLKSRQIPRTWKVVHRVWSSQPPRLDARHDMQPAPHYYLDQPRWYGGIVGHEPLAGSEPILDLPAYLYRHSELAFIVLRDYALPQPDGEHFSEAGEGAKRPVENGYPLPTGECIQFVSRDLREAYNNFVRSIPPHNGVKPANHHTTFEEISAPFLDIYHNEESFLKFADLCSRPIQDQWRLLWTYLDKAFSAEYAAVRQLFEQGLVIPKFVKYLFRPGEVLHRPIDKTTDVLVMVSELGQGVQRRQFEDSQSIATSNRPVQERALPLTWSFKASYYSFRTTFTFETTNIKLVIPNTTELIPIQSLYVYPVRYAPEGTSMRLQMRGEAFWKCRRRRFVEYSKDGSAYAWSGIKSRYMIDPVTYLKMHGVRDPVDAEANDGEISEEIMSQEQPPPYPFPLLTPKSIKGYNFVEKRWDELQVDCISDVDWNTKAFENLVTDEEMKDLLEALVTNHLVVESSADLISGKGNGLVILLHGGPGTGKTYTAESVADYARKPLYRVTCGDMGTKAVEVEKYLETVLRLGRIWGCVVLLDEADVFLEERSLADLERNALVSVFLRVLEYYNGILILTSNRVGYFDEAFRSRIQLALHYKSLDQIQRKQIWTNFLKNLRASGTCEMDFDDLVMHVHDLSMFEMNGRQIRNTITTARQLADFRKKSLNYEVLRKVIRVAAKFDTYLQSVKKVEQVKNGTIDDELAREAGTR